jgi:HKD family nuclease
MYTQKVYVQAEKYTGEIIRGLVETAIIVEPMHMLASVAYASLSGCRLFNKRLLDEIPSWNDVSKDWLIGLDNGITEPKSLEYLANLPNSTVHLFDAHYLLNNDLQPKQKFHTKLYVFESDDSHAIGMFSGSANLTLSGLYLNTEQAISVVFQDLISKEEKPLFDRLHEQKHFLENVLNQNANYSHNLYQRYRELCEHRQDLAKNEDERRTPRSLATNRPEFNLDKASAIAIASNFWVEIRYVVENLGKGLPGNQIDLQRGSRVFFGFKVGRVPRNTVFGARIIRYGNQDYECHMRFGNNQMDKLNLPAPNDIEIETYEDKILHFTRMSDERFKLRIYPRDNLEKFRILSGSRNSLYRMKSGREYGVY